jgi:NTP pyrophosphatase (non-canonical NTP hydrolase)
LAEKEKEKDAEITSLKATIERLERESDSLFRDACVAVRILMTEAYETAKSKGWHEEPKKTIPEAIALMHSELSEALEEYRKSPPLGVEKGIYSGAGGKPEGIAVEFADVVIRIFDTCQAEGFDLPKALRQKMEYNKTREHRHGGKKI